MKSLLADVVIQKVRFTTTMFNRETGGTVRQNRPYWGMIFKYEGETVYTAGNKRYISNANHVVLLPKGSSYTWQCIEAGHCMAVDFDCDLTLDRIFSIPIQNGEKFVTLLKQIEHKRLIKAPLCELESLVTIYSILWAILDSPASYYVPSAKEQKLWPAIAYITDHYTEKLQNETLASRTGLSVGYFRQLFYEVYGVSPMNYVKNLRMKKAKEMLRGDYGSITDIALSLGYPSVYDFSRDFKKHVGISPKKYS